MNSIKQKEVKHVKAEVSRNQPALTNVNE